MLLHTWYAQQTEARNVYDISAIFIILCDQSQCYSLSREAANLHGVQGECSSQGPVPIHGKGDFKE